LLHGQAVPWVLLNLKVANDRKVHMPNKPLLLLAFDLL
jgi:hypothetical protein